MNGGTGTKTGVELRYYNPTEFKPLSMEEKDELRELHPESKASKGDNKNKKGKSDDKNRRKCQREKNPLFFSKAKLLPSRNSTSVARDRKSVVKTG